jgi:hypothetical protein
LVVANDTQGVADNIHRDDIFGQDWWAGLPRDQRHEQKANMKHA